MSPIERLELAARGATTTDRWFLERMAAMALDLSSDARMALLERETKRRGVMPPLHARGEDEAYYVLEGELTFFVGDEIVRAGAGEVVVAGRDVPRTYRVESPGARWLLLTRAPAVARLDDFGRALARPGDGSWSDQDEAGLAALGAPNGIRVLGPPGMLPADLAA